ncbi:unnamed protein product, partial [Oikopleura dioica]
ENGLPGTGIKINAKLKERLAKLESPNAASKFEGSKISSCSAFNFEASSNTVKIQYHILDTTDKILPALEEIAKFRGEKIVFPDKKLEIFPEEILKDSSFGEENRKALTIEIELEKVNSSWNIVREIVFNSQVSVSRNQQCESSNSILDEILACQRQNLPFTGAPGTDHEKTFLQTFFQRREGILKSDFEITKEEARHAYLGALVSNAAGMILAKNGAFFVTQRFKTLSFIEHFCHFVVPSNFSELTTLYAPCLNPLDSFVDFTNLKLLRRIADGKEISVVGEDAGSIADAANIFKIRQERVAHRLKALYFSEALRKLKRSKVVLATFEDYKYRDRLYFPELGFSIKKRFEWPEKEGLFRVKISNGKDLSLNVDFDE